jgi:hypothetical protein
MPIIKWSIRRYNLSSLNGKELDDAVKAWVEEHGCKTTSGMNKPYIGGVGGRCVCFQIAPPGKTAWKRAFVDLSLYYIPPILYAATTNYLPLECSDLFDNFLEPWVLSRGGTVIDEQSLSFDGNFWNHPPDYFKGLNNNIPTNITHTKPALQKDVKVHLNTDFERIQTHSETGATSI